MGFIIFQQRLTVYIMQKFILLVLLIISVFAIRDCTHSNNQLVNVTGFNNIKGSIHPNFYNLTYVYESLFATGLEKGSTFATYRKGCKIVDLYGGNQTDQGVPWSRSTLTNAFSVSKGILATVITILKTQNEGTVKEFKFSDKVTKFWPAFGQNGKQDVTISELLSHRAGLSRFTYLNGTVAYVQAYQTTNSTYMDSLIEQTVPAWNLTTKLLAGYGSITTGWTFDGLIRRLDLTGRNAEQVLFDAAQTVPELSGVEFYYTPNATLDSRIADLTNATFQASVNYLVGLICTYPIYPGFPVGFLCGNLKVISDIGNDVFSTNNGSYRYITYAPAAYLYTTAKSLAQIYSLLADSEPNLLVSDEALHKATKTVWIGYDLVTTNAQNETNAGYEKPYPANNFSPNPEAFGRYGLGGQICFADKDYKVSACYLTRNMYGEDTLGESISPCRQTMTTALYNLLNHYDY